jgi:hypothetical protein
MEALHRNALVLVQPDPEQFPGEWHVLVICSLIICTRISVPLILNFALEYAIKKVVLEPGYLDLDLLCEDHTTKNIQHLLVIYFYELWNNVPWTS